MHKLTIGKRKHTVVIWGPAWLQAGDNKGS